MSRTAGLAHQLTVIPLSKNKKASNIILHFVVWGILFGFPVLFSFGEPPPSSVYLRTMLPLFFSVALFYLNYFILIDRLLFRNQFALFILINIALVALCLWGQEWIEDLLREHSRGGGGGGGHRRGFLFFKSYALFRTALSFLLTVMLSVMVRGLQRWRRMETERKAMETEQLKSTLSHLQYQIQPHFFFNSLNNIYSLVDSSPEKAKESIHGLSKLMRYLLYDAKVEHVALSNEITFLKNYIQLMRLRLTDKVNVQDDLPEQPPNVEIAPLLFIPLVENAFKHGVSASQPSTIIIKMRIENKQLLLEVENTNFPKTDTDKGGSGIGLENLKRRLELLYPNQYEFTQEVINGIFRSNLKIVIG